MESIRPLIENLDKILLFAFCVVLLSVLFGIYSHLRNIDKNLWIMSHDTYDFLEDIHGELVRLEVVIASEGALFNEVHQLEVDGLIGQETHQLSRDRRGSFRGWQSNQRQYTQAAIESDIEARARDISRLIRVLRLKNEKEKHHESD